jgi:hypothetical protein
MPTPAASVRLDQPEPLERAVGKLPLHRAPAIAQGRGEFRNRQDWPVHDATAGASGPSTSTGAAMSSIETPTTFAIRRIVSSVGREDSPRSILLIWL